MKKKIAEGKALGLKYEIFDNSGIIDHIEFSQDMIYIAPKIGQHIRVPELNQYSFHMNRQQSLQLEGEKDSIELKDMDANGNDGQELTLFLLTHGKNSQGSYFSSLNHDTCKTVTNSSSMRAQLYPWVSVWCMFVVALLAFFYNMSGIQHREWQEALLLTLVLSPIIMLPLFVLGSGVGFLRSLLVKRNSTFKNYAAALSQSCRTTVLN